MDRIEALKGYTDTELLEELNRRIDEYNSRADLLKAGLIGPGRNARKSQAKMKYWRGWHEYRAQHPNATLEEWRKARTPKVTKSSRRG